MAVTFSYNALVDLEAIEDYIKQRSNYPDVARKFIERLTDALEVLNDFPEAGIARDDLSPDIRQYVYKGYIALYSVTETGGVLIQAVIQGNRDIEGMFKAEE
jgi:plasmid stabilization system protein ParE